MTRSATQFADLVRRLGTDLGLQYAGPTGRYDDADLATTATTRGATARRDLTLTHGVEAARQMLVNRIQTRRGELAPLGHPRYGSRHHELIGEPHTERTRNLVKLHVLDALRHEPRVAEVVECTVTTRDRQRDVVRIDLTIRLIDEPNPLNLVVPFELEGSA